MRGYGTPAILRLRVCRVLGIVLEVESKLCCVTAGTHIVGPAESRQKVVESHFVGQVDDSEAQAPLVLVGMEEIVDSCG